MTAFIPVAIADAEPFATRDQNPLLAAYGLPLPMPARLSARGSTRLDGVYTLSNTSIAQFNANEQLVVDVETQDWRLIFEHGFSERLAVRVELPYRSVDGGHLDHFIENWHHAFGLPNGNRANWPQNEFALSYARNGASRIDLSHSVHGWADASLGLGYQWYATPESAMAAWLTLELPSGDPDRLTGNDGVDAGLSLAMKRQLSPRWSGYAQLALTRLHDGGPLQGMVHSMVWSGAAEIEARTWKNLYLSMQLDAHSAVADGSRLTLLGKAVWLTFGGRYQFRSGWRGTLGMSEDLKVDASPDVSFILSLGRQW